MSVSKNNSKNYTFIYHALVVILLATIALLILRVNDRLYNTNKFLAQVIVDQNKKPPADIKYGPNDIIIGEKDAPVNIFVYTSYRCIYCKEFFENTFPDLKKEYVDNGQAKIIIKNIGYKSDSISLLAAKAAYCAYAEGYFLDIHMKLLEEYNVLNETIILNWMDDLNIDSSQFKNCLSNKKLTDLIFENAMEIKDLGARGTPSFVIGNNLLNGSRRITKFRELIDLELEACCE